VDKLLVHVMNLFTRSYIYYKSGASPPCLALCCTVEIVEEAWGHFLLISTRQPASHCQVDPLTSAGADVLSVPQGTGFHFRDQLVICLKSVVRRPLYGLCTTFSGPI
jgi:hypothetical protein